jgi:hypothetical protein
MKTFKKLLAFFLILSSVCHAESGSFYPSSALGGGGGGTPGGSNTQIQYNNAGSFGGDSGFTTNGSGAVTNTGSLTLTDDVPFGIGTGATVKTIYETADANANVAEMFTPEGGAVDVPGLVFGDVSISNVDLGFFNGLTDPFFAIMSDDAANYVKISQKSSGAEIISTLGGINFLDTASSAGYTTSFKFQSENKSTLTPSMVNDFPLVNFDLTSNQTYSAGSQGIQAGVKMSPHTLVGTAPGTSAFGVVTFAVDSAPIIGSDFTSSAAIAGAFGSPTGWDSKATSAFALFASVPGVTTGSGFTSTDRFGISVGGPVTGASIDLGNQVRSMTNVTGISIEKLNMDSTAAVTLSEASGLKVKAPSSSTANLTITNGPYAITATGNIKITKDDIGGFVIEPVGTPASMNDLVITSPYNIMSGTTTVNTITRPQNNLHTTIKIECTGNTTFNNLTAGTGAQIKTIGGLGIACTDDDVITFDFNGTYWNQTGLVAL